MLDTAWSSRLPEIARDLISAQIELIHRLARPLADRAKLVIPCYAEEPDRPHPRTKKPGCPLPPSVFHVSIGDVEKAVQSVCEMTQRRHYNVYMPLAVFQLDLPLGRKGSEREIMATLGLVADFDDDDAARWAERLPLSPSAVLKTSAGRFQCLFLFDRPEPPQTAKPVAERLKVFANCDHGTADISHVWRIAGTLNWPNARKLAAGRSRDPQLVRVAMPWTG